MPVVLVRKDRTVAAAVPHDLVHHIVRSPVTVGHRRLWCFQCGHVSNGIGWHNANDWCPDCDYMGIPILYTALRRMYPDLPSQPRRSEVISIPGWVPNSIVGE